MDKVLQMLQLQQDLNDATNGLDWERGFTKDGKIIDWKRCTFLECAELIESYPWKHWKNIDAKADYANIKIEAVDIWHFIMSESLKEYKNHNLGTIKQLSQNIHSLSNFKTFNDDIEDTTKNYYEQIECVEEFLKVLFSNKDISIVMDSFISIAIQSGLNLDSLYELYIGKNILNKFRQDNGYKDGSYIKIWNDKEDNVVMQDILRDNLDITPDILYRELDKFYPKG